MFLFYTGISNKYIKGNEGRNQIQPLFIYKFEIKLFVWASNICWVKLSSRSKMYNEVQTLIWIFKFEIDLSNFSLILNIELFNPLLIMTYIILT